MVASNRVNQLIGKCVDRVISHVANFGPSKFDKDQFDRGQGADHNSFWLNRALVDCYYFLKYTPNFKDSIDQAFEFPPLLSGPESNRIIKREALLLGARSGAPRSKRHQAWRQPSGAIARHK